MTEHGAAEHRRSFPATGGTRPDRRRLSFRRPQVPARPNLLIQRYLTLLATVQHPESIVAVTFTRKAAGEMRHRVVDALQKAMKDSAPEKEHERQTWELCRRVLARDHELGWRLISHPSRLRIQTIDSLCGMLVGQMPWLSRMGAGASPEEKAEYLYREAARMTIELLETTIHAAQRSNGC